jgi:archaellum biogenesis protein FlaJ (TadC family)
MALIDNALADPAAAYLLAISIAVLVVSLFAVPWIVARMPADYFVHEPGAPAPQAHPVAVAVVRGFKNTLGAALVVLGVAMLILPGQGILTILVGLSLTNFPGKRQLQRQILSLPAVAKVVAALRRRAGRPPLILE